MALVLAVPAQAEGACLVTHDEAPEGTSEVDMASDAHASTVEHGHGSTGGELTENTHSDDEEHGHCGSGCEAECAGASAAAAVPPRSASVEPSGPSLQGAVFETAPDPDTKGLMRPPRIS